MEITREELYRRVWETPVRTLAKEFDISDVGLAKACRKHQIPLPPVGYWTKVQFGKKVRRPALPKAENTKVVLEASRYRTMVPSEVLIELKLPAVEIQLPANTEQLAPFAAATFKQLNKDKTDERGLVNCGGVNVMSCSVSPTGAERAARLLHAIETALPQLGAKLAKDAKQNRVVVEYEGTTVKFRLHEQYTRKEHVVVTGPYSWSKQTDFTYQLSGNLTFEIEEHCDGRKRWSDGKRARLEEKLAECVAGLVAAAKAIRKKELYWELQRQKWAEESRRREEEERCRREEERFRNALIEEAGLWRECQAISEYLSQIRRELGDALPRLSQTSRDWLARAEDAAQQMQPLGRRLSQLMAAQSAIESEDDPEEDVDSWD